MPAAMKKITLAALILCSLAVRAEDEPEASDAFRSGFYLAPVFAAGFVDQARLTGNATGFGLGLGYRADFAALEFMVEATGLRPDAGGARTKLTNYGFNALFSPFYQFPYIRNLHGLLGFSLRDRKNHPGYSEDDQTFAIDAGLSYQQPLSIGRFDFALRADYLYRLDTQQPPFENDAQPRRFQDRVARFGLVVPLSLRPAPAPAEEPPPVEVVAVAAPADDDQDGVLNALDQCPQSPAGSKVDARGCPPPTPPRPKPKPKPCKADAGQILLDGCKTGDVLSLPGVEFETDQAVLTPAATLILDRVAAALLRHAKVTAEIGGHTDDVGRDGYNLKLSQRRAEAVRDYLVGKGIAADRLTAQGYGETQPKAANDSDEHRQRNRRVELKILVSRP